MDLFVSAGADPIALWTMRATLLGLGAFIVWALFAERSSMGAFLAGAYAAARDVGSRIWAQWGPLIQSRAVIGAFVMYATTQAQIVLSPEQADVAVQLVLAGIATLGLLLSLVGRIFARGPIPLHSAPLRTPAVEAEFRRQLSGADLQPMPAVVLNNDPLWNPRLFGATAEGSTAGGGGLDAQGAAPTARKRAAPKRKPRRRA